MRMDEAGDQTNGFYIHTCIYVHHAAGVSGASQSSWDNPARDEGGYPREEMRDRGISKQKNGKN